jgi:hypothetical protein
LTWTLCGTAFAAEPYQFVKAWGSYGTAHGQFLGPGPVAAGPGASIYVADSDGRVQVFDRSGGFVRTWSVSTLGDLVANQPAGHVYARKWNGDVAVYDPNGQLVRTVTPNVSGTTVYGPIAADSVDSFAIVFQWPFEAGGHVDFYGSGGGSWSGWPLFHWHGAYPIDLAIDPNDTDGATADVAWNDHVDVITQRGWPVSEVQASGSTPIAVDAARHLFRVDAAAHAIRVFDADGTPLGTFGSTRLASPAGITVDTAGNVYVTDQGTHRVVKFAPGSVVSPQSIDFGSQPVGTVGAPGTVKLTNLGTDALTLGAATLGGGQPASFSTGSDTCTGATLASGQTCSVDVVFAPQRIGDKAATLVFTDDAGATVHLVPVSGNASSAVQLSPTSLTFAARPDHTTSGARTVTLTNVGGADLTIDGAAVTGTDAASFLASDDTCGGQGLATGQSCTVRVRFRPLGAGDKTARLRFTDSATDSPQSVLLSGAATPSPWLEGSVQGLKFGRIRVGSTSPAQSVTLTNVGSAPMTIGSIVADGTNPDDFVGLTETCTALGTLGPGQSCTASIAFRPTATGARSATLTITDSAPRNPHRVTLQGPGT